MFIIKNEISRQMELVEDGIVLNFISLDGWDQMPKFVRYKYLLGLGMGDTGRPKYGSEPIDAKAIQDEYQKRKCIYCPTPSVLGKKFCEYHLEKNNDAR